jgi:hypothetical protein
MPQLVNWGSGMCLSVREIVAGTHFSVLQFFFAGGTFDQLRQWYDLTLETCL